MIDDDGQIALPLRGVYGSPRIWADLVLDYGEQIGRKRVERLIRQAGLSGLSITKYKVTYTTVVDIAAEQQGYVTQRDARGAG